MGRNLRSQRGSRGSSVTVRGPCFSHGEGGQEDYGARRARHDDQPPQESDEGGAPLS